MDIYPSFTLYLFNRFALRFVNETNNRSGRASSSSSPASMHIRFAVFWRVEMKNALNSIDVDTSGSYIGGDKHQRFAVGEVS